MADRHNIAMSDVEPQTFGDVDLSDAVFRETYLPRMIGVVLVDAVIDGLVQDLTVNGVEVTGYVQAELDRRFPVRPLLRSSDPDDLRAGWATVLAGWQATTSRIAALSDEDQHRRSKASGRRSRRFGTSCSCATAGSGNVCSA